MLVECKYSTNSESGDVWKISWNLNIVATRKNHYYVILAVLKIFVGGIHTCSHDFEISADFSDVSWFTDARGAIWQGDLRLPMYSTTHESSVAMVPTEYFLLINNHTHTKQENITNEVTCHVFLYVCVCNQQKRLVSSDDDDNM